MASEVERLFLSGFQSVPRLGLIYNNSCRKSLTGVDSESLFRAGRNAVNFVAEFCGCVQILPVDGKNCVPRALSRSDLPDHLRPLGQNTPSCRTVILTPPNQFGRGGAGASPN